LHGGIASLPRPARGCKARGSQRFVAPSLHSLRLTFPRAAPGDRFWDRVVARMKVGETKSADVRLCLQRPVVKTSNGVEERWIPAAVTFVRGDRLYQSDRPAVRVVSRTPWTDGCGRR
jgi:hypothetical protein